MANKPPRLIINNSYGIASGMLACFIMRKPATQWLQAIKQLELSSNSMKLAHFYDSRQIYIHNIPSR